jgi:uncharacterized protein
MDMFMSIKVKPAGCPICRKPSSAEHTPFCSRGCKDRDLMQWLGEGYRIPGPATAEESLDSGVDSED